MYFPKGDAEVYNNVDIQTGPFSISNAKLSDNDDGFILVDRNKRSVWGQDSNKVICVKACLSVEWKRFTMHTFWL